MTIRSTNAYLFLVKVIWCSKNTAITKYSIGSYRVSRSFQLIDISKSPVLIVILPARYAVPFLKTARVFIFLPKRAGRSSSALKGLTSLLRKKSEWSQLAEIGGRKPTFKNDQTDS